MPSAFKRFVQSHVHVHVHRHTDLEKEIKNALAAIAMQVAV